MKTLEDHERWMEECRQRQEQDLNDFYKQIRKGEKSEKTNIKTIITKRP